MHWAWPKGAAPKDPDRKALEGGHLGDLWGKVSRMAISHTAPEPSGPTEGSSAQGPSSQEAGAFSRLKAGLSRWGREIWMAMAQLTVLGILLALASRWVSGSGTEGESDGPHVAMPRINPFGGEGAQESDALEGGAFRTQGVVDREVDFGSEPARPRSDGSESERQRDRDARDPTVKDFKGDLARFGVPVISGAEVKRAVERRDGPFVVRELHFDATRGVGSVTRHYRNVFRNQGYRMQETHLGELDGVGRELVGGKGKDRVVAKVRVDDTGRAVQVSIRQRIEPGFEPYE